MALRTVFQIRPEIRLRRIFRRSRIFGRIRKTAGFRPGPEPKSGTAPVSTKLHFLSSQCSTKRRAENEAGCEVLKILARQKSIP